MPSPPGHPAHQPRPFRVKASYAADPGAVRLTVQAQTERDAILRAGIELAIRYPLADPALWLVRGVEDPAPRTWTPPQEGGGH